MKGFIFQNGIEFRIEVLGEEWSQGSAIEGVITSKPSSPLRVQLAEAQDRKVKAKAADAFKILESFEGEGPHCSWKFQLPLDALVTSKTESLYLLYGRKDSDATTGALRLNIIPHEHFRDIADTLIRHYRFAGKSISTGKKGQVEFKLAPPDSKEFASLESLLLLLKLEETTLELEFIFTRKSIDATGGSIASKTVKRTFHKSLPLIEILHSFNQRIDKDRIQALIEGVLGEYQGTSWL